MFLSLFTGDHSKSDLWYAQKPVHFPFLTNNISSYFLCPHVIVWPKGENTCRAFGKALPAGPWSSASSEALSPDGGARMWRLCRDQCTVRVQCTGI